MGYIYIFKCQNNKYFVELDNKKYNNINDELLNKVNCKWTEKFNILSILNIYNNCTIDEIELYTERYMKQYGINNVRGGIYNNIILSEATNKYLKNKLFYKTKELKTKKTMTKLKKYKPKIKYNKFELEEKNYMDKQKKEIKQKSNIKIVSRKSIDDFINESISNILKHKNCMIELKQKSNVKLMINEMIKHNVTNITRHKKCMDELKHKSKIKSLIYHLINESIIKILNHDNCINELRNRNIHKNKYDNCINELKQNNYEMEYDIIDKKENKQDNLIEKIYNYFF